MAPNFSEKLQEWARRTSGDSERVWRRERFERSPVVGMTEMRLVSAAELRDIESTRRRQLSVVAEILNDSNASASTSRRSNIVRRMMSLSSCVPTFIANVNKYQTQHFVNQTQRRFLRNRRRRNPSRNNDSNDSNTSNSNNGSSSDNNNQQQQNGSY